MRRFVILVMLACALGASAQTEAFLTIGSQNNIKLPWGLYNLSVVDGRLYGCSDGMMMTAVMKDDYAIAMVPDTLLQHADPDLNYVVRNPRDGRLYFCVGNGDEGNRLYVHLKDKGVFNGFFTKENERVVLKKWKGDVSHPTFSPDGNLMVFTSKSQSGFGGYDLWGSCWDGQQWGAPFNMGSRINTPGNDIHPVFYGEYLIFASDGLKQGAEGYSLYATRIRTQAPLEEIVFDNYVVQQLPAPINSDGDDWEMAVDSAQHRGYWISYRSGKDELYGYTGRLDGIMLWGTVTDADGSTVADADVTLSLGGRTMCSTRTTADGTYSLFVQPNQDYKISISKNAYFQFNRDISVARENDRLLISEVLFDVRLQSMPLNQPICFDGLFGTNADIVLTAEGIERLRPLVNFLRDNPLLKTVVSLSCDQTTDQSYNILLTERRISAVREYLLSVLPPENAIFYNNGTDDGRFAAAGSRKNQLIVVLSNTY